MQHVLYILISLQSSVLQSDILDTSHDGRPLALPLRPILEAMIEPFFGYVHPILPIFCKKTLIESIETIYGGLSTGSDHAWKICLNNLILLTLIPQTHQRHLYNTGRSSNKSDVMHSEASMIIPFIENSRRAFQNLELLLQPRLVNVQALATLVSSIWSSLGFTYLYHIVSCFPRELSAPGYEISLVPDLQPGSEYWTAP